MTATLINADGTATEAKGGVAYVKSQPTDSLNPEAPAQLVLGPDPLSDAAHAIENLSGEETAISKMDDLILDQSIHWFQIGGTLLRIKENGWFGEFASFRELCLNRFGFSKSKGYYLVAIYERLLEAGLSWGEVKELGWPKLRLICEKAVFANLDKEEFFQILENAKAVKYVELEASLKPESSTAKPQTKTLVFKPHPDQLEVIQAALVMAKKETGSDVKTVNLDHVCMTFLSPGASTPKDTKKAQESADTSPLATMEKSIRAVLKQHDNDLDESLKEVFEVFEKVFPNIDVDVHIRE